MGRRVCRRCNRIPRWDESYRNGFGAVSLTDGKTRICSDCGVEEKYETYIHGAVTPQDEWPVK